MSSKCPMCPALSRTPGIDGWLYVVQGGKSEFFDRRSCLVSWLLSRPEDMAPRWTPTPEEEARMSQ